MKQSEGNDAPEYDILNCFSSVSEQYVGILCSKKNLKMIL